MLGRILNNALLMTWLDMITKFGFTLLMLPLATIYLKSYELAFYFYINTILGLAYLGEGGVNRVILRATSFFKCGRDDLPNNIDDIKIRNNVNHVNYEKIGKLIASTRIIYLLIIAISLFLFFTVGYYSALNILKMQNDIFEASIIFGLLSLYVIFYLLQLRLVGIIHGFGFVAEQKRIESIFGIVKCILCTFSLVLGFGMIGIVLSMITAIIISYVMHIKFYNKHLSLNKFKKYYKFCSSLLKNLFPSIIKQSVLAWGSFLIYQGITLIIVQVNDPDLIDSYLFTSTLIQFIIRFSNVPSIAYYPKISYTIANNDHEKFYKLLKKCLSISLSIYSLCVFGLFYFGEYFLDLIGANTYLLEPKLLLLLFLIYFLELNHVIHATIYTASNHIPFIIPSLVSGFLIISIGFYIKEYYGLFAILLTHFLVQLSWNNWYPVMLNMRLFKKMRKST